MQLPEALRKEKQNFASKAPKEVLTALDGQTEKLRKCGLAENCLGTGDKAPDFTLLDQQGREVHLYECLRRQPVVLAFFRGDW